MKLTDEPLGPEMFLHTYRVTMVYEMGARDERDARRQADYYTLKDTTVEKIQDRSVPHVEYLARVEEDSTP